MEDLKEDYNNASRDIIKDIKLESLNSIKHNLEKGLGGIRDNIKEIKAEIVIGYGLGYRKGNLSKSFPNTIESEKMVNGVWIITRTAKDGTQNKLYFSKEMGIFIKGEPKEMISESSGKKGLYCKITETNLSIL